ncbi:GroES-like protein [Aspergillus carlsbadensis]|nr:GroES-like protein [Aspergillus carlsbadensis]
MQKAIVVSEVGKPAIAITRRIPQPKANELLLRVTTTSLNPADQKTRDAGLFFNQPNQFLGHELAGEIIALGEEVGVTNTPPCKFTLGDRVVAQANFSPGQVLDDAGALQQYTVVDARFAARIDGALGVSDEKAVTIPVCAIASFIALFGPAGVGLGLPMPDVSVSVPSSFARMAGFGRIVTTAAARNEAELKSLGATHVIDRHGGYADTLAQIRAVTGDELVHVLDAVNLAPGHKLGLAALSRTERGCLVTLNRVREGGFGEAEIGVKSAGYEYRMTVGFSALYPEVAGVFWERVMEWVRDRVVRPLAFRRVEGLDAAVVNGILDGYRDGGGEKVVFRV